MHHWIGLFKKHEFKSLAIFLNDILVLYSQWPITKTPARVSVMVHWPMTVNWCVAQIWHETWRIWFNSTPSVLCSWIESHWQTGQFIAAVLAVSLNWTRPLILLWRSLWGWHRSPRWSLGWSLEWSLRVIATTTATAITLEIAMLIAMEIAMDTNPLWIQLNASSRPPPVIGCPVVSSLSAGGSAAVDRRGSSQSSGSGSVLAGGCCSWGGCWGPGAGCDASSDSGCPGCRDACGQTPFGSLQLENNVKVWVFGDK